MRTYLLKTDDYNMVAFTDGQTVKVMNDAPDGKYDGIDLYAEKEDGTLDITGIRNRLQAYLTRLDNAGELQDYSELGGEEWDFLDMANEIKKYGILVFDDGKDGIYVVVKSRFDRISGKMDRTVIYSGTMHDCVEVENAERSKIPDRTVCDVWTASLFEYRRFAENCTLNWRGDNVEVQISYGEPRCPRPDYSSCMYAVNLTRIEDEDCDEVELYAEVNVDDYLDSETKERRENGEIDDDEIQEEIESRQDEMERDLQEMIAEQADEIGLPLHYIIFN